MQESTRDWLLDNTSLTLRIKQHCHARALGSFSVKLLWQGMAIPSNDESQRLDQKYRRYALIREVLLFCGDTPLIFARTVIPIKTLTGRQRQLAHLGNRPLGEFLFSHPCLERDAMEVSVITAGHQLYKATISGLSMAEFFQSEQHEQSEIPRSIWARRSVFRLQSKALLVAEVFLPELLQQAPGLSFVPPVLIKHKT
jgi:chorismate--pyruvate lyase